MVWKLISLTSFVFNIPEEVKKNPERGGASTFSKNICHIGWTTKKLFQLKSSKIPRKT